MVAKPGSYTGSPMWMLLGEKDDNLPVAKIESYLATPELQEIQCRFKP